MAMSSNEELCLSEKNAKNTISKVKEKKRENGRGKRDRVRAKRDGERERKKGKAIVTE